MKDSIMKYQAALVLMLATAAYFTANVVAYECPAHSSGIKVFEANLDTGNSYIHSGSRISWLKSLTDPVSGAACSRQGVIKITFPYPKYGQQRCRFKFDLHLSGAGGWNFNIGDSTNNGYGGDAGQTSNAAEVHNIGDSFFVYSNILNGYESYADQSYLLVEQTKEVVSGPVSVTVGDKFVKFESSSWNKCYASPYLFTLNGQATNYGPVNYDIFFSMNRVIYPYSSVSRTGTGLCKATITAMDCEIPIALPPGGPLLPPGGPQIGN